jgi:hypothetical protein
MRAERRLGECIHVQKETVGPNPGGWKERKAQTCGSGEEPQERTPALADAGIDKKPSSRAQKPAPPPFSAMNSTPAEVCAAFVYSFNRVLSSLIHFLTRIMVSSVVLPTIASPVVICPDSSALSCR